jgi:hypothetical protein
LESTLRTTASTSTMDSFVILEVPTLLNKDTGLNANCPFTSKMQKSSPQKIHPLLLPTT